MGEAYYRSALAYVHDQGFPQHAPLCAPGVLDLLAPVKGGTVLEIGCGSGLLTRLLLEAGHTVIATDASPAMLTLAQRVAGRAQLKLLTLPDDPLPAADAVVGVGHALNYLPDAAAVDRAWRNIAEALEPGGVLAVDICDLEWGRERVNAPDLARVGDDWAILTRFSTPEPTRFVRDMTVFVRASGDAWRRDDETHENVLVDTAEIPGTLARHGVAAEVRRAFGQETLPTGLRAVVGRKV